MERLQKIISRAGAASRRAAEQMIAEGRVTVDGVVVEIGAQADESQTICIDGKPIHGAEPHVYFLLNKPKGYISTAKDDRGRKTVLDLLPEVKARIYPVGRLDNGTEGLLLLTNDGELMNGLLHPRYEVQKTYVARLAKGLSAQELRLLREGVQLEDGLTAPARVRTLAEEPGRAKVEITIHEGRNRQVRRMCEQLGWKVTRLRRVSEGSLKLGELKTGCWRPLTEEELAGLRREIWNE